MQSGIMRASAGGAGRPPRGSYSMAPHACSIDTNASPRCNNTLLLADSAMSIEPTRQHRGGAGGGRTAPRAQRVDERLRKALRIVSPWGTRSSLWGPATDPRCANATGACCCSLTEPVQGCLLTKLRRCAARLAPTPCAANSPRVRRAAHDVLAHEGKGRALPQQTV